MIRLATSPQPYTTRNMRSSLAMFKADRMTGAEHRDIPAPEPAPEPNPAPDDAMTAKGSGIAPADWDTLFDAVIARLQAGSSPVLLEPLPEHLLGISATLEETVSECIRSLNRLHAALTQERQQHYLPH